MEAIELAKERGNARELESNEVLSLLRDFIVDSDKTSEFAAGLLREVKARGEAVDAERRKISDPLRAATQAVNDLFRPAREAYAEAERILKKKVVDYLAARDVANRAALKAAGSADTPEAAVQALSSMAAASPPEGVSVRYAWKFRVVDSNAVPREFCSPDVKKIGACDPGSVIPGVEWFQEPIVASRRMP